MWNWTGRRVMCSQIKFENVYIEYHSCRTSVLLCYSLTTNSSFHNIKQPDKVQDMWSNFFFVLIVSWRFINQNLFWLETFIWLINRTLLTLSLTCVKVPPMPPAGHFESDSHQNDPRFSPMHCIYHAVLISCTEPVIQLWNRRRPKALTGHTYSHTSKRINIVIVPTVGFWGLSRDTLRS